MPFRQWLHTDSICLDYDASPLYPAPDEIVHPNELRDRIHNGMLRLVANLLDMSGKIVNSAKLFSELIYNDHRVSAAVGENLAIPHSRTLQARELTVAFVRCRFPGVDFEAPDNAKVFFFIGMATPPYDDRLYTQLYQKIAQGFLDPAYHTKQRLLSATTPDEIVHILDQTCWYQRIPETWEYKDDNELPQQED